MMAPTSNPITPFLQKQGVLILDGGLATELEARGSDLDDPLWSAKVLMEDADLLRQVHLDYLVAGADCIVSASYQATIHGFMERGIAEPKAVELLRLSVRLALEARDMFWSNSQNRVGRMPPIVGASVGPYGAFLADGSEYTGDYGLSEQELYDFHAERWQILAATDADILACETIPSRAEAQVLLRLLTETPERFAWFSFSCRDEGHLSDGTLLTQTIKDFEKVDRVAALGVNCTAPRFIPSLITAAHSATDTPVIVYPNSGEQYDAVGKKWIGSSEAVDFGNASVEWHEKGASLIGGCCRTRPADVREIRRRLVGGGK